MSVKGWERVEIKTPEELRAEMKGRRGEKEIERLIGTKPAHLTRLYLLPDAVAGTVMVASEIAGNHHPIVVPFFLTKESLNLVAENADAEALRELIGRMECEPDDDAELLFGRFLESIMLHDMEGLQEIEVTCYAMEEWLISGFKRREELEYAQPTTDILRYRKQLLMRNFYYQQFMELCNLLAVNQNGFFGERALSLIAELEKRADRLCDYSQMLREYLVQIRELYQQQIDIQKNKIMQVLTVVTTIFLPLTLIAGWYGMNFEYMPELHSPYGYRAVVGVAVLIFAGEILYFRRKKFI